MPRRSRLFSLPSLARAYQRNLKAIARAAGAASKPVRAKAVSKLSAAPRKSVGTPAPSTARVLRPAAKPVPLPGEWISGVAPGPAGARRFHVYVPTGLILQPGEKLPLLVMLHGCGQTGRDFATVSRMNRLAVRHRFVVLYPEQERVANAQGCWNWFERRNGRAEAEAATLLAAIDKVARRLSVDLARVAVAGLSAGASMAVLMAALFPDRFCAVAMHSGVAPGTAESAATALAAMHGRRGARLPEFSSTVAAAATPKAGAALSAGAPAALPPLLIVHGDADGVVSVRNAAATAQLWAGALGARAGAVRTLQRGQRYPMRVTEFKARGRIVVALREVVGLAHAWSGGAAQRPYSDPAGPNASALIWTFVARQFGK